MTKTILTPTAYSVLKAIVSNGDSEVPDLVDHLKLDRGKVEGTIANLLDQELIIRELVVDSKIKLTDRGVRALSGLPERQLLDVLIQAPIPMKSLTEKTGLDKDSTTAAIGILRKANVIKITKGILEVEDEKKARSFSVDLQDALRDISDGRSVTSTDLVNRLKERGMVEIEEKQRAIVKAIAVDLSDIQIKETVTRLTPQMLQSGRWNELEFKPYALDTKPRRIIAGRYHPYRQFLEHLKQKLIGLGFEEMKGPLIEQEYWNFDSLFAAQDHPAREDTDILLIKDPSHGKLLNAAYVKNVAKTHENGWKTGSLGHRYKWDPKKAARLLLRPQGTSISARTLAKLTPPAKYFSIARCFRPDQIDATHAVEFDQTEGIIVDESITFQDLLGMLKTFATEVAGATKVRFRPDFYPFTSPSVELSAKHPVLGYIEFGGAGIFRPEVTQPYGIDYPVLAWGLGVGRLFMTKYQVSDIRELFSQNIDYLRNEMVSSGISIE